MPVEDVWEGFDRFCKVQEVAGNLAGELKEFQLDQRSTTKELSIAMKQRITDEQF
jgi:hypothetical protein